MPLNNYFNIKRFSLLLQQDLLINRTKYVLSILGLGLITYLLSYWFFTTNKNLLMNCYTVCFIFYMMAVGVVVGTAFPELTDKIKTANYLLLPASTFEKFLAQFLLRIGFFIPIALAIFWIAIRLAKASLVSDLANGFDVSKVPNFQFRLLASGGNELIDYGLILFVVFGFFSYGSYLFAGTTYFKRYALIKTVIFSAVILVISILFSMFLSNIFYTQAKFFDLQLQPIQVAENLDSLNLGALTLTFFSWMFFLAIGYFKLKEKEA